jgi:hypothetical protein
MICGEKILHKKEQSKKETKFGSTFSINTSKMMNISKIYNSKKHLKLEWKNCSDKNGKIQKAGFVKLNKI